MKNIAIIGAGGIAHKMARTINLVEGTNTYAIASRNLEKAQAFAKEFGFDKAYGSYEELVKDPNVDLVYIATPHSHHYKFMKLCIENGKNVISEKAFTVSANQARKLVALAKEKNVLLAEAIWPRYMPSRKIINDIIDSGIIGEKVSMIATLGSNLSGRDRIEQKELAGGSILDLGVYALTMMRMFFPEKILEIQSQIDQEVDGVDKINHVSVRFEGRKMAMLNCNARSELPSSVIISGTKGYIQIQGTTNPTEIKVICKKEGTEKTYEVPEQLTGFEYELMACVKAIDEGKIECEEMPHSEIVYVMELMDTLREQCGYELEEIE